MNKFLSLSLVLICLGSIRSPAVAQSPFDNSATSKASPSSSVEKQIDGLVIERKKYSITVRHNGKPYTVRLASDAQVGLRMNKPWFDWKRNRVVVDALSYPLDPDQKPTKRVAIDLPSDQLYLISRFNDAQQMKQVMSTSVKRMNFYLITPTDPGAHMPTEERPFICGNLSVASDDVILKINEQTLPIRLGFRLATMNGFSIAQLEPNKTQVFLSGVTGSQENEIIASQVLFQPVQVANDTNDTKE